MMQALHQLPFTFTKTKEIWAYIGRAGKITA